jgi:hypothetical protein
MDNLRDFLKNEQTHPGLGKAIVKILNSWHDGDDVDVSNSLGAATSARLLLSSGIY